MEGDVSGTPDPIERDSEATEGGDDPDGASTAADRAPGRPTSVRARAEADGEEYGVGVRLFDLSGDESFAESLCGRLDGWRHLSRADGVITVVDHGASPRPWAITEYVEQTLAGRGRIDAAEVLTHARALTGALVTVHQRGLVHGGIDPRDVVYPADTLGGARPMLDNVGLMAAYRTAANPAEFLDPRYAAPEYFESCYGCLDHATDIYGLGVVLYRIATGYPPFEGSYDDIRRQVIEDRPPAPSAVNTDLPGAIDDVIAKATAKNKLTRYETAQRFHREVCRICEAVG